MSRILDAFVCKRRCSASALPLPKFIVSLGGNVITTQDAPQRTCPDCVEVIKAVAVVVQSGGSLAASDCMAPREHRDPRLGRPFTSPEEVL